jgi:hypothetical protein
LSARPHGDRLGDDERHAVAIAQEWLDYSERLGIDPLATATVE